MKIQIHTPIGIFEKELTLAERQLLADLGDRNAKEEIEKENWAGYATLDLKIEALASIRGIS